MQPGGALPPLQMAVTVRHERDPYLAFLDLSDGTKDFGLSTKEKVRSVESEPARCYIADADAFGQPQCH